MSLGRSGLHVSLDPLEDLVSSLDNLVLKTLNLT
jgi:hypothetical protein